METIPVTLLLLCVSLANTFYLFTRVKIYRLHHYQNPPINGNSSPLPSSPNASLVSSSSLDFFPSTPLPLSSRIWYYFSVFWRFLLNMDSQKSLYNANRSAKDVVQLDVWTPGEGEGVLFAIYSPVHSLLWMATTSANWMLMVIIMGLLGVQVRSTWTSFGGGIEGLMFL
jgi:hypothetical protein